MCVFFLFFSWQSKLYYIEIFILALLFFGLLTISFVKLNAVVYHTEFFRYRFPQ